MENMASENFELSRGHKQYDAEMQNIIGILNKVDKLFDVTEYEEKVRIIKEKLEADNSFDKRMPTFNIQMDYEDLVYDSYIDKIKKLTKELNEKYVPFYELYLLTDKINSNTNGNARGLDDVKNILDDTINLINMINTLNTHNIKEKNVLINEAYKVVYKVILYEEMFNRSDVLNYINKINISVNKEHLGRLLANDIKLIDEKDVQNEDLRVIRDEGLGYDYLATDIVRSISRKKIGEENPEYQEKKRKALENFNSKAERLMTEQDMQQSILSDNNININAKRIKKVLLNARFLSLVLIPVITFSAGKYAGKSLSNKITEYKTITRSIDLKTGNIIGDTQEIYDEKETTYVATVLRYTPWRVNPIANGYIRNAIAYEYATPDNVGDDYHITLEEMDGNIVEKYRFTEAKEVLDQNDSMTEETIIVTETYQDKLDNQKSTKYILPLSIVGAGVGIALSVAAVLFDVFGFSRAKFMIEKLNRDIMKYKWNNEEIRNRLLEMQNEAIKLKAEYANIESKYGDISDNVYYVDKNNKILSRKR